MAQPDRQLAVPATSNRWSVTKAVRASGLPAASRLVMLTLADVAEVGTAEIPERHTPSLSVLADETGLDRSTVRRHLASLEAAGWIVRMRPDPAAARALGERTRYRLTVPAVSATPPPPPLPVEASTPPVGAQDPQGRGTVPPEVGAENTTGRGTVPPIKNRSTDQVRSKTARAPRGSNSKPPDPIREQADELAKGWWERYGADQGQSFIAVRSVITGALRNGVDRNRLAFALDDIGQQHRAVSGGAITVALDIRSAGGSRASPNGHRPYRNPADLSAYQSGL